MQNDYIMKIVEQIVQAILSIIRRRKSGEYKEARELVKSTSRYLFKTDIDILLLFPSDQILEQFKDYEGNIDPQKAVFMADILYELALIEEAEKKENLSLRLKSICLHLYTVGIPRDNQFHLPQYFEKVDLLRKELEGFCLPEQVVSDLASFEGFLSLFK